jgi:hypothetical protein
LSFAETFCFWLCYVRYGMAYAKGWWGGNIMWVI